jgi:hypothetical protein
LPTLVSGFVFAASPAAAPVELGVLLTASLVAPDGHGVQMIMSSRALMPINSPPT